MVIEALEKSLGSWTNRFLSLGGRVMLINSVLASIPIFIYLFFLNANESVEEGCANSNPWMKWDTISKVEGTSCVPCVFAEERKRRVSRRGRISRQHGRRQ